MKSEPLIRWDWVTRNWDNGSPSAISTLLESHMLMAFLPVLLGLLVALPLGLACVRWPRLYQPPPAW